MTPWAHLPGHSLRRVSGKPCDACGAGEVRHEPATVGDGGIAQRRIRRKRLFLVDIEGRASDPILAQRKGESVFVDNRTREVFTRYAVGFISRKVCSLNRWKVGVALSPARSKGTCTLTKSASRKASAKGTYLIHVFSFVSPLLCRKSLIC